VKGPGRTGVGTPTLRRLTARAGRRLTPAGTPTPGLRSARIRRRLAPAGTSTPGLWCTRTGPRLAPAGSLTLWPHYPLPVLEKQPDNKPLPSVSRAAASPTAIVLAGAGVAIGVAAHLGVAIAVVLGAAGYGARLGWAAVRRRAALRKRAERRMARIDPWSVPEPWRGYTARALDARKRYHQLAQDCLPGAVADYLAGAVGKVDGAVEEGWALGRSGASLSGPPGRADQLARELDQVHATLARAAAEDRAQLESREAALASELRALRRTEAVGAQLSARLSELSAQLEGVVASAGQLVAGAGAAGTDLSSLSSELGSLNKALDEARGVMASTPPGDSVT
jgi:hypothetical protein